MLAARMYGVDDIRLEKIPVPKPSSGEVLIRVKAAAVCGTDVRMIKNGAKGIDENNPLVLCHEIAGIIEEVGSDVQGYQKGERVAVAPNFGCGICDACISGNSHLCSDYKALGISLDGGFAEYCIVPEAGVRCGHISVLEESVSFESGAINEPLSCVFNGFEKAAIKPGDTVLIVGAGPIGIMHCALALMAGAVVYLNDVSEKRLEEAKKLYPNINLVFGDLEKEFMNMTKGRGADAIITACPVPSVQETAVRLAALEGRIIFFGGIPASKEPVGIDTNLIHYKQLLVSGTTRASLLQYRKTLRFISLGIINGDQFVTKRFSLSQIHDAIEAAADADGIKNVIVFE